MYCFIWQMDIFWVSNTIIKILKILSPPKHPFVFVCVCVCGELSLCSQPLATTDLTSFPILLSFLGHHINGIKCSFYVQLLCLNIMFLRLIHIVNGIDCWFFIIANEYSIVGLLYTIYIPYIPYTIYYSII